MSFRCGIFFIIFAVLSCVKKPPQTSNAASIVIGEVSQDKVAHDGFKVSIKRGGTSQDYGNPAELTAAKFSAGDNIILAMQLSKAGKIVAESKTGSEKCSPVMLTLIAGGNPIKVPLCLTNGINSDPVVVNPPSESGAAVSAQPCIVGAENCNPTDPLTDYKKLDMIDYLRQHTSQITVGAFPALKSEIEGFQNIEIALPKVKARISPEGSREQNADGTYRTVYNFWLETQPVPYDNKFQFYVVCLGKEPSIDTDSYRKAAAMLERQKSQGLPTGDTTLRGAPMVSVSFFSDGNLPEVYLFLSGCKA